MVLFGQLVVGPPGSGKSTYCNGMQQFLSAIGRKTSVVNLDPANDNPSYDCALDVRDFITLDDIMAEEKLGPNGGILYALEQVEHNVDQFVAQFRKLGDQEYFLLDCPGQVELFTHHGSLAAIFRTLEKELGLRLCVVNLIDSIYITQASQYISVLLLALRTMLQFSLPQVNVLSKIDLLSSYGPLPMKLDYYTEVQDLDRVTDLADEEIKLPKLQGLTKAIAQVVEDFGLVEFQVLAVENKKSMIHLLSVIDKASGYLFGSTEIGGDSLWVDATRQGGYTEPVDVHERWIEHKREYDEAEAQQEKTIQEEYEENADSFGPTTFSARVKRVPPKK